MSYKTSSSNNFSKLYLNGYTSKEYSLLEKQNIQKLISGNIPKMGMLPSCHLSFGNIGKIKFDFGLPTTDPMNLNMFKKLSRLSDIVRGINDRCITLIEELKCCQLAELYNNLVIPVFEWVLKDFINTLVSIAEGILKSYQVMKVIFCTVRPVPGNPWLRGGGFDFLKYLYSFVEGFEAVYKWLVDGNPIDIILNPAEAFYKKISSCSPDKKRNLLLQDGPLRQADLKQIITSYSESNGTPISQSKLDQANEYSAIINENSTKQSELLIEKNQIEKNLKILQNNFEFTDTEYYNYKKQIADKEEQIKLNEEQINDAILNLDKLSIRKNQDEISAEQLVNNFLAKKTLDKLIIDAYNPVCSCLLEMAGIHGFSPPNYITLNTRESFDKKADGRVLYGDKDRWITAIKKTKEHKDYDNNISSLYISYENFPAKFSELKLKIERNMMTSYYNGYALNGNSLTGMEDFGDSTIRYNTTDEFGVKTRTFKIDSTYTTADIHKLYTDSGYNKHNSANINEVFDLNGERLDEKNIQNHDISVLESERRYYTTSLEKAWNYLRKQALDTLAMGKLTDALIDELDVSGKKIFNGASDIYGGAIAGAKNIYDNTISEIQNIFNTNSADNLASQKKIFLSPTGNTITTEYTPEQQKLIDEKIAIINQRTSDITLAKNAFSDIEKTSTNLFTSSLSVISNPYQTLKNIGQPTKKILEAQIMLDRLGTSFDILTFISLYDPDSKRFNNGVIMPDYVNNPEDTEPEMPVSYLIKKWSELNLEIDRKKGMVARLDILVEIDNFVIEFVDDELQICGCDILCVILQQILDIITSAINALIKLIIDRLLKMVMNEQVTYIIKIITEKLKCFLMATEISKNIKKIGEISKAIKKRNEVPLNEANDPANCKISNTSNKSVLDKLYINDEIHLNTNITTSHDTISVDDTGNLIITDPILHTMPDFGTNSSLDIIDPNNTLVNNGATIKDSYTGRNIPSLYLDCSKGKLPNIEIEISQRSKFEILIAFIPGDSILDAPVISTPQIIKDPLSGITDINGNPINSNDIVNPTTNLADIMDKVNKQVQSAISAPVCLENDCTPKNNNINNNLVLCSRDNLSIESILLIENDTIVNDNHLGKISTLKISDNIRELYEYYPEHKDANKFGMVKLLPNTQYWIYSTPDTETKILPSTSTISTSIVPSDTIINNTVTTTTHNVIENFTKKIIETTIETTYIQTIKGLEKNITTTISVTVITPFRKPNLELLINFKNSVNHFKIRGLLDVIAYDYDDVSTNYDAKSYNGRYLEYVKLGACPAGTGNQYIISFDRLIYLSTKILKAKYIITTSSAVAASIEKAVKSDNAKKDALKKEESINKCLLSENLKTELVDTKGMVDNLLMSFDEATLSMNQMIENTTIPEPPVIPELTVAPILKSIPFLVLNKEQGILVQIIKRKMYLQFPVNAFHISEPVIIDYELIPNEIYMFIFNTNGYTFNMSIITADKEVYSATGMNTSLSSLQPSIVGGNENGTITMCGGTILDIIISKNGNNTIDYFNRSLMGYIPRLSQILFDFSLVQGSRVYNTITNITNGYATKIQIAGSLSNEYGYGAATQLAKQQADMYGEIISNQFYQILKGYMDNFFCKDNLGNKDFSISLWIYNLNCKSNHHSIISDDIGKNYIYYDAIAGKILINFDGHTPLNIPIILKKWTNILLKYNKYTSTFYLVVKDIDGVQHNIQLISKNKFFLMSLLAEYDKVSKKYVRTFNGYLSTISIFMSNIDDRTYSDLFNNQKILIRGMEK